MTKKILFFILTFTVSLLFFTKGAFALTTEELCADKHVACFCLKTDHSVCALQPAAPSGHNYGMFDKTQCGCKKGSPQYYKAPDRTDSSCEGFLGNKDTVGTVGYYLHFALITMRYLAIILALVLSVIDFFKAVFSQDKDLLKKASSTAIKRIIYAVVIFFIPTILEFILGLLGAYTVKCV